MPAIEDYGFDRLPPEERLALAEALWESVTREIETALLPDAQRLELERRLADSIARPEAVTPWEEIKARGSAKP